jgi:polysaccharide export outer membrane protein
MKNTTRKYLGFLLLLSVVLISGCVPLEKVKYLQDIEGIVSQPEYQLPKQEHLLQPGDYLYIKIMTPDNKNNEVFSNMSGSGSSAGYLNITEQNLYLTSYMVNDSGYVNFPLIGNIEANGITLKEFQESLNKQVNSIVKEAEVVVKQVLFSISVLGEVRSPGRYPIYKDNVNIFEAFAMANDLTTFANRNKVQIIRKTGDKINIVDLDLTKKDILKSPYFYLEPNDIIYIEPLKMKNYTFEAFPYGLIVSTLTTIIVIATYFKK